jgi:Zn-dependent hydrolases, including glyoxylases
MLRRQFIHQSSFLAAVSLMPYKKLMKQIAMGADFNVRMLRENVGIFTERGGTIGFLLNNDGIVVIDAQFPDTAPHLIAELQKRDTHPFTYLLNTHHHGDHTSGNIAFKGIVQHVAAHENSLKNQKAVAEKNNSVDKQLYPEITFSNEWNLNPGKERIQANYYGRGHTDGDAVYHFQHANIAHVGDLMFNKRHPFVDRSAGANMASWIKDIDHIIKNSDKNTIFIFGHSLNPGEETGTAEDLRKFQDYLGKVLAFAESESKKGVNKEDFIKNATIPGVTEWTGDGIQRPLTAAYEEVTEKA